MPETLYLTCNLIDRYLALKNVTRKRLQLVGAATHLPRPLRHACPRLLPAHPPPPGWIHPIHLPVNRWA